MDKAKRILEWARFYKQSALNYNMNALLAVYENDGEEMLLAVLKELGLLRSLDLVKDAAPKKNRARLEESSIKDLPTAP